MNEETKNDTCSNASSLDFARLATLTEDELAAEQQTWDVDQWEAYYLKDSYMTVEEFLQVLYDMVAQEMKERYGIVYGPLNIKEMIDKQKMR